MNYLKPNDLFKFNTAKKTQHTNNVIQVQYNVKQLAFLWIPYVHHGQYEQNKVSLKNINSVVLYCH